MTVVHDEEVSDAIAGHLKKDRFAAAARVVVGSRLPGSRKQALLALIRREVRYETERRWHVEGRAQPD